jgi:hypothetical protein
MYADRGEAFGQTARPSLTRELFGADSPWEKAASVRLEFTTEDSVEVTVSGRPETRDAPLQPQGGRGTLRPQPADARRQALGRLRHRVGPESVKIELNQSDPFLVTHVYESTTGVMFLVVPLSGESAHWFRFPRLKP